MIALAPRRTLVFLFGLILVHCTSSLSQTKPERFWLAGRYDGNRIIVYFEAVKFHGTVPSNARRITDPVVFGFFGPVELPESYIAQFQKGTATEHFAIGDRYDVLLGNGDVATVTLSMLVGTEGDEQVGNDSYIGALGSLKEGEDSFPFTSNYYALRRHVEPQGGHPKPVPRAMVTGLVNEPVAFNIQTQIASLLNQYQEKNANAAGKREKQKLSLTFKLQPFHTGEGRLRYYVRAEWKSGKEKRRAATDVLAAWIAPLPTLHLLAVEPRFPPYSYQEGIESAGPNLLNAIDLGHGRTGIIFYFGGGDSGWTRLMEYTDGVSWRDMRVLQSIEAGE